MSLPTTDAAAGRRPFQSLCVVLAGQTALFTYFVGSYGNGDFLGVLGLWLILFVLVFFTAQGIGWVRWLTVTFLLLLGLGCLGSSVEQHSLLMLGLAISYAGAALALAAYPPLVQWLAARRPLPPPIYAADMPAGPLPATPAPVNAALYPSLLRRMVSSFIDLFLLLCLVMAISSGTGALSSAPTAVKVLLVAVLFSYEPLLTIHSATLGQRLVGLRVRRFRQPEQQLSIPQAYLRSAAKLLLGWLSYLAIHTNREKRAIHDLLAGSVMLRNR